MTAGPYFFVLAVAGLASAYAFTMRGRVHDLQDELSTARAALEQSHRTAVALREELDKRDEAIARRDARLARLEREAASVTAKMDEVMRDENAARWGCADLPDDVVRLLHSYGAAAVCVRPAGTASGGAHGGD